MKLSKPVALMAIAAALCGGLSPLAAHATNWTITDLGTLGGGRTVGYGINNSGQVVGSSYKAGDTKTHAFITGANGIGIIDLGTLGGASSTAFAVNASGQVVGYAQTVGYTKEHAFVTGANGVGMKDLGTLGGDTSRATGINDAGRVVGDSSTATMGTVRAFASTAGGTGMSDLGTPAGNSTAAGINGAGRVVGNAEAISGFAANADGSGLSGLIAAGASDVYTSSINGSGQVAGYLRKAVGNAISFTAFISNANAAGIIELGTLGGSESYAWSINSSGQAAGHSTTADGEEHAFVTGPGGTKITDLNSEVALPNGAYLTRATAINDKGQVVVNDSAGRAYLLTPVAPNLKCTIVYSVTQTASNNFSAKVTINNVSSSALSNWNVSWAYNPATSLKALWNAKINVAGSTWTATPGFFSSRVPAKGSVNFMFNAAKGSQLPTVSNLKGNLGGNACGASVQ